VTEQIKEIPLGHVHKALGAKILPFAGFNMPILYSNLIQEHMAVRESVGVFDVSHMGEFVLKGDKALDLIQKVCTNDASKLVNGKVQYSCLTNATGGIVDDLLVYRFAADEYYLVVNASNIHKDWEWISQHNTFGVEMENISDRLSLFAVQGPKALDLMAKISDLPLKSLDNYEFLTGSVAGVPDVLVSTTGYTGAGGVEVYVWNKDAEHVWNQILNAGQEFGVLPVGLGARDTLRTEMGYCLYGNDISDLTSPIEAGLGWITKFTKDFIGSDIHKNIKTIGPEKKLVGFKMLEKGIPRQDYQIVDAQGTSIGIVTSGTQSPCLNVGIGMGYVNVENSSLDTEIYIQIRNNKVKAKVCKMPFI
jgi:aminomethyltransferase